MLVIGFSIGVDEKFKDEMRRILMNYDYGIKIRKEHLYYEKDFSGERVPRVYFDCYAPKARLEMLARYLENDFAGTAILSY